VTVGTGASVIDDCGDIVASGVIVTDGAIVTVAVGVRVAVGVGLVVGVGVEVANNNPGFIFPGKRTF
jgi:hypothetical protein